MKRGEWHKKIQGTIAVLKVLSGLFVSALNRTLEKAVWKKKERVV